MSTDAGHKSLKRHPKMPYNTITLYYYNYCTNTKCPKLFSQTTHQRHSPSNYIKVQPAQMTQNKTDTNPREQIVGPVTRMPA